MGVMALKDTEGQRSEGLTMRVCEGEEDEGREYGKYQRNVLRRCVIPRENAGTEHWV